MCIIILLFLCVEYDYYILIFINFLTFVLFSELWPQCWDCKSSKRDVHSTKGPKGGLRGGGQQEVGGTKAALYTRGGKCQRLNVKVKSLLKFPTKC